MSDVAGAAVVNGVERFIPLNKLEKSPKNARKAPHGDAAIEALAASIAVKGVLQNLVVEPKLDGEGRETGAYYVTIGEGRRLAQLLRVKRKEIKKTEPIRCVVDTVNDAHEISLDENVTRTTMHPADEVEAFKRMADEQGRSAEDVAARFGVTPNVVRQRLRLAAVSPRLMQIYREDGLTLNQLMAFAVSEDHARQEQVYDQLSWNREPNIIRRAMTETKVPAADKRALLVGVEAYTAAGGVILRDLFTEDGGGWFETVDLLDRLAITALEAKAAEVQAAEGWKWAEPCVDFPHAHGLRRLYPHPLEVDPADQARFEALVAENNALADKWGGTELPPDIEARFAELEEEIDALEACRSGYTPAEIAQGGVFVILQQNGAVHLERGFIRPEDEAPEVEDARDGDEADDNGRAPDVEAMETPPDETGEDEAEGDTAAPLPDRLIANLTAHRTAGLRAALAANPDVAVLALIHALVLRTFYAGREVATCLDVRCFSEALDVHAPEIGESRAGQDAEQRHEGWSRQLPEREGEVWAFVVALDGDSRMSLLAHCVAQTANAVRSWERRAKALAHADALAQAVDLDMTRYWEPTGRSYFERVTKARIVEDVREAVSDEAASRVVGKKPEMVEVAEQLVAGSGWLPVLLRTPSASQPEEETAYAHAAE